MGVTGIGGLFFRARDPKALAAWYERHFDIASDFSWRQSEGPTVFMPFSADTDHFPADKAWMVNLRVDDLAGLLDRLRAAEIEVITKAEWDTPETGRFARVHDPEGNPIELWEPPMDEADHSG